MYCRLGDGWGARCRLESFSTMPPAHRTRAAAAKRKNLGVAFCLESDEDEDSAVHLRVDGLASFSRGACVLTYGHSEYTGGYRYILDLHELLANTQDMLAGKDSGKGTYDQFDCVLDVLSNVANICVWGDRLLDSGVGGPLLPEDREFLEDLGRRCVGAADVALDCVLGVHDESEDFDSYELDDTGIDYEKARFRDLRRIRSAVAKGKGIAHGFGDALHGYKYFISKAVPSRPDFALPPDHFEKPVIVVDAGRGKAVVFPSGVYHFFATEEEQLSDSQGSGDAYFTPKQTSTVDEELIDSESLLGVLSFFGPQFKSETSRRTIVALLRYAAAAMDSDAPTTRALCVWLTIEAAAISFSKGMQHCPLDRMRRTYQAFCASRIVSINDAKTIPEWPTALVVSVC